MNLTNPMTEIEQLEAQKVDNDVRAKRGEMAMRLANNRDFKKLILEDFCVEECSRCAQLSGEPSMSAEDRADALAIAQAAGHLRRWLHAVTTMGRVAGNQNAEIDEVLDELRAEDAADEAPVAGELS